VRPAAVAGQFYDADPDRLRAQVERYVDRATAQPDLGTPKAVIAPHAGFRYSGPTAGFAYRAIAPRRGTVTRVVLIGPAHRVRVPGVGVSTARAWATPLGEVPVDVEVTRSLLDHPAVVEADDAHASEHSLEVHLPFLLATLGPFTLIPLVVGHCAAADVASVLLQVWGGDETLVVASTDLSHYHDDATARVLDRRTADAIVARDGGSLGPGDACGRMPVAGLLVAASQRGLDVRLLDLSTSADTEGPPERVVGYGSFALVPA
jgi:AmmeMemoRadiSam system protein B